ncbi:arginine/serine-rich protein 1 isoform X5 [Python bivittatus]|uniref:Arginine/serine-rich protein 1 n=1 Tax=Python bivittatus TaxID=176946 RepID=A0A9F5IHW1_PYTBI|nr:arginine/serine-rich protein 1 isoform X5 [Python bivittatus]
MAVTNEAELSPQGPPRSQEPSDWHQNPHQIHGSCEKKGISEALDEKRELLEIAKANAAKTFGKEIVLPASLRIDTKSNENGKPKENNLDFKQTNKQTEDERNGIEMNSATKGVTLCPNNIMPRPLALKSASLHSEDVVSSGREEKKEGPIGQWIPVKNEENVLFHNISSKRTTFRAR